MSDMTPDQVLEHYGTQARAADAIGISRQVMSQHTRRGKYPLKHQVQWEVHSGGKLRADLPEEIRNS